MGRQRFNASTNFGIGESSPNLGQIKKLLCCPFGDKILRLGRSVGNLFFFFLTRIHVPRVKVRAPKQNMHSKWWLSDCQSTFLAVKPKTGEFNTILTTKLNDPVLKMASFVTNYSKNWSLNTKKKKTRPNFCKILGRSEKGNTTYFF